MFAAVPFYNLRKLHKAIAYDTGEPMRGYLRGIRTIVRILKKQREDPSYFYTPTFPSTAQAPKIPA
jgi:fatty acid desaturase